jgi:hypothetical protein
MVAKFAGCGFFGNNWASSISEARGYFLVPALLLSDSAAAGADAPWKTRAFRMEIETVAFGYLARALVLNSGPTAFGYPRHGAVWF